LRSFSKAIAASAVACWKIMHQHNAFAVFLQLRQHRLPDLLRLAHLEVEGVHVGGEDGDVARAEISDELRRLPQRREAEVGRGRMIPTARNQQ
jgi:hypothetical protein